jgi:hypothetical protein
VEETSKVLMLIECAKRICRRSPIAKVTSFLVGPGRDHVAGLNDAPDRSLARARARNLPVTFVNHATNRTYFDLDDDRQSSRELVADYCVQAVSRLSGCDMTHDTRVRLMG